MTKDLFITISCAIVTLIGMYFGTVFNLHYLVSAFLPLMLPLVLMARYVSFNYKSKLQYLIFTLVSSLVALFPDLWLLLTHDLDYTFPIESELLFWPVTTIFGYIAWLNVIGYPVIAGAVFIRNNKWFIVTIFIVTFIFTIISSGAEQIGIIANWWSYNNMEHINYGLPYFVIARYFFIFLPLSGFLFLLDRVDIMAQALDRPNGYKISILAGLTYGLWTWVATLIAYYFK